MSNIILLFLQLVDNYASLVHFIINKETNGFWKMWAQAQTDNGNTTSSEKVNTGTIDMWYMHFYDIVASWRAGLAVWALRG